MVWLKRARISKYTPLFKSEVVNYKDDDILIKCIKETVNCRNSTYDFICDLDHLIRYLEPFEKTFNDIDKHHFIAQYIQYHRDYMANKDKFDNEKLAKIDYSKWFFEDDEYVTVFPKSKQDFITEGQKQNNCVGGYYNYVIENKRIVTFIRRKDDIDKPLVTCDICNINNGVLHISISF